MGCSSAGPNSNAAGMAVVPVAVQRLGSKKSVRRNAGSRHGSSNQRGHVAYHVQSTPSRS